MTSARMPSLALLSSFFSFFLILLLATSSAALSWLQCLTLLTASSSLHIEPEFKTKNPLVERCQGAQELSAAQGVGDLDYLL